MTKSDLLQYLYNWNPELIKEMKDSNHHYDMKNLSPHHLEGDVWTHTMMVYSNCCKGLGFNEKVGDDDILAVVSFINALMHDAGKPRVRQNHKDTKINFWGHENASIPHAVDFLYYLQAIYNWTDEQFKLMIKLVTHSVCYHLSAMNIKKEKDLPALMNYDYVHASMLADIIKSDKAAQIRSQQIDLTCKVYGSQELPIHEHLLSSTFYSKQSTKIEDCKFILMGGVPGVGKDYVAEMQLDNPLILSWDKIRINKYIEAFPEYTEINTRLFYNEAFHYCNDKKINLNKELRTEIIEGLDEHPGQIVIANTNCNKRGRRGLVNLIKHELKQHDHKIGMMYVVAPQKITIERDKNRSNDKTIGSGIITKFLYSQTIPTMQEGFDCVEIVPN